MGIFGKREEKASRVGRLMAVESLGRPMWTPRDYASLAKEGFTRNPIVYRAVRMIAEAAASAPWLLYEGEREVEAHPLLELLKRPNPAQPAATFMESVYGHLLVAGNAYLEVVALDGVPRELFALRPDRMKVVPGPDGWPRGFQYTAGSRTVELVQEGPLPPILHLSLFHPLNDHYGFAPIEAAQTSLDIHNASGAWAKALLDNAARPSGALVYNGEGHLNDEQFERADTGVTGVHSAGRRKQEHRSRLTARGTDRAADTTAGDGGRKLHHQITVLIKGHRGWRHRQRGLGAPARIDVPL